MSILTLGVSVLGNEFVQRYFFGNGEGSESAGHFHQVINLNGTNHGDWETLHKQIPTLPKGWFELSKLSIDDRIDFVRGFWTAQLPYKPHVHAFLDDFFNKLLTIEVYLTQQLFDGPFESQMVYSLREGGTFYRGGPSASEKQLEELEQQFANFQLPEDFIAFLKIHNGFAKGTDTGLILCEKMEEIYYAFQDLLEQEGPLKKANGEVINPHQLIPFYQSFGLQSFQCFFNDWYPEQEMGNLYYSAAENSLSDYSDPLSWADNQAFPTFLDWLVFYLETFEV